MLPTWLFISLRCPIEDRTVKTVPAAVQTEYRGEHRATIEGGVTDPCLARDHFER